MVIEENKPIGSEKESGKVQKIEDVFKNIMEPQKTTSRQEPKEEAKKPSWMEQKQHLTKL